MKLLKLVEEHGVSGMNFGQVTSFGCINKIISNIMSDAVKSF